MSNKRIVIALDLGRWQAWQTEGRSVPIHGSSTESEGPMEALARLLILENQGASPSTDPIQRLRMAAREIWNAALQFDEDAIRNIWRSYRRDRLHLHGAAWLHATALGVHVEQVAALCASYDSGLDVLRKALPD